MNKSSSNRGKDTKDTKSNGKKCDQSGKSDHRPNPRKREEGKKGNSVTAEIPAPPSGDAGPGEEERNPKAKWANDPEFYYTSQNQEAVMRAAKLSFNKFPGVPFAKDGIAMKVGNIIVANVNPSPGITPSDTWGTRALRRVGINQAAFDMYTELTAQTGRTSGYAPQDISTLLLAMGDMISTTEDIRRMFKILFTYQNMNWAFPQAMLEAINVDPVDFAKNYASYIKQFDALITRMNKFHMFGGIRYFHKCLKIYSNLYKDGNSEMAQIVIFQPATIWELDEQSYSGGSILTTVSCHCDKTVSSGDPTVGVKPVSYFLGLLENQVDAIQNSSTFQKIFADVLNYMRKMKMDFDSSLWRFAYYVEDTSIEPVYAPEIMLQLHNTTITGCNTIATDATFLADKVTPYNDVYPDAGNNALLYNPAFNARAVNKPTLPHTRFIDLLSDAYAEVDTLEFSRYAALAPETTVTLHNNVEACRDVVLSDHYIRTMVMIDYSGARYGLGGSYVTHSSCPTLLPLLSQFDWAPLIEIQTDNPNFQTTGFIFGDLNFFSEINYNWLLALNQITNLSLFTFSE